MKKTQPHFLSPIIFVIGLGIAVPAHSQSYHFDSLLMANSYEINYQDGRYSGPGLEFLADEASKSQFFCLCEEHNLLELNQLSSYLFQEYHDQFGYNYLVLEQGCAISSFYGLPEYRGNYESLASLVRNYPQSPTFATDEELRLIADAGRISTSPINPIWGVDQDLGALHILERLKELAPNQKAQKKAAELADLARYYEMDRINGDTLFMSMKATPEMFSELPVLFQAKPDSEAAFLIEALQRSNRIYTNNRLGIQGEITQYKSVSEREHSMKLRFLEQYRKAQEAGDSQPKVFAKMGHYHLLRGIYRLKVTTFGNLLSELAISNGSQNFVISSFVIHSTDPWRRSNQLLEKVTGESQYLVVDFRPIRDLVYQHKVKDLPEGWDDFIYRADAGLIVNGGGTGNYEIVKSALEQ